MSQSWLWLFGLRCNLRTHSPHTCHKGISFKDSLTLENVKGRTRNQFTSFAYNRAKTAASNASLKPAEVIEVSRAALASAAAFYVKSQ